MKEKTFTQEEIKIRQLSIPQVISKLQQCGYENLEDSDTEELQELLYRSVAMNEIKL
jgi:hypothetical protein